MAEPDDRMWMVRAGWHGTVVHNFVGKGVVYVNEDGGGPICEGVTMGEMQRLVKLKYPTESLGAIRTWAKMILNFWYEVQIGDVVVTYDPSRRHYHIGTVQSHALRDAVSWVDGYTGEECKGVGYVRAVRWTGAVGRDVLSDNAQKHLGRPPTLFTLPAGVSAEIRRFRA